MGFFFAMKFYGNIRKMKASINGEVNYFLPLFDNLNSSEEISMNELIGQTISISYSCTINCVVSGKMIKKRGLVHIFIDLGKNIQAIGKMTKNMVKEFLLIQVEYHLNQLMVCKK